MAAALLRKQARRQGIRKDVDEIVKNINDIELHDTNYRTDLIGMRDNLVKSINELETLDIEITNALEATEVEADVVASRTFLRPLHKVLAKVNDIINKDATSTVTAPSQVSSTQVRCKLPKLELPTFNGNPLKWFEFWDQYNASIDSNETISDIDKFSYLKRYLSGKALSTISGLTLTATNYQEAIAILHNRFGDPQVQITAHMDSLIKLKPVKSLDHLEELRKLYNDVESCVRNLKSLKVEINTYGCLLIPILNERLPEDLKIIISRKFGSEVWTLELLLTYFDEELKAKEGL